MTRLLNEAAQTGWLGYDVNSYYTSLSVQSDLILNPKIPFGLIFCLTMRS